MRNLLTQNCNRQPFQPIREGIYMSRAPDGASRWVLLFSLDPRERFPLRKGDRPVNEMEMHWGDLWVETRPSSKIRATTDEQKLIAQIKLFQKI